MDARYFDLFARALAAHPEPPTSDPPGGRDATTTRRRLLGIGARVAAPLAGITAALLAPQFDAALAKDRRRRRKQRHRRRKDHGKRQHGCGENGAIVGHGRGGLSVGDGRQAVADVQFVDVAQTGTLFFLDTLGARHLSGCGRRRSRRLRHG